MIRKFECWNCRTTFTADDKSWVECPHCHSDNVEYATFHLPAYIRKAAICTTGTVLFAIAGYYAVQALQSGSPVQENITDENQKTKQIADSVYIKDGGTIAPSLSVRDMVYDEEKGTYHCVFNVDPLPAEEWKIVISSYYGNKQIAVSNDGVFDDLPYSPDDGFYRVKLVSLKTDSLLCEERDFPNFEKQVTIQKGMTERELETHLNGKKSLVDNPYIAHDHEVIVANKPAGDTSETGSLGQVQDLLQMCALKATVSKVEYNEQNKISKVILTINYPDDWIVDDE